MHWIVFIKFLTFIIRRVFGSDCIVLEKLSKPLRMKMDKLQHSMEWIDMMVGNRIVIVLFVSCIQFCSPDAKNYIIVLIVRLCF